MLTKYIMLERVTNSVMLSSRELILITGMTGAIKMKFIGIDTDEQGTVYMFQSSNFWVDFRLVDGLLIVDDYGLCSDWSTLD